MIFVIFSNDDRTETGMCAKVAFEAHDRDTDGRPMRIVHEFEADTWDEAKEVYEDLLE